MSAEGFWVWPADGAVPDLADLLQVTDLSELQELAMPWMETSALQMEAELARAQAELRQMSEGLTKKGVRFDVDRIMRPSLWERIQDWWWDWRDGRAEPAPAAAVSPGHIFAVNVPLAQTRSPKEVPMDYAAQGVELERFTDALCRQISAQRGQGAWRVTVPDAVLDDIAEEDDPSDVSNILYEASQIAAYWPPYGQPALALSIAQEDMGLPIRVDLLCHGSPAHRRFEEILRGAGGALRESGP